MSDEHINWESEYSVGVAEIDKQHLELLNFVNDLINNSTENQKGLSAYNRKVIEDVINHVAFHFETEERILSKTNYEKFGDHKKEHEKISAKINNIRSEIGNEKSDMALYNLTITLKEYFLSHILLFDKDAAEYFREGEQK